MNDVYSVCTHGWDGVVTARMMCIVCAHMDGTWWSQHE